MQRQRHYFNGNLLKKKEKKKKIIFNKSFLNISIKYTKEHQVILTVHLLYKSAKKRGLVSKTINHLLGHQVSYVKPKNSQALFA